MGIKALLIILIITSTSVLQAQRLASFTHEADSVFKNLNKNYITTGILYDRVYPYSMLHVFNSSFFDTTNVHHFKQAYFELYNAKYYKTSLVKPDTVDKRMNAITITGMVPIGIINFQFNQIDTNSVVDNLLENRNGIFYDVPSRPRSPYWKKEVSIISPLIDSIEGLQVNFQTSPDLYLQNTGHTITSLKADFNNGMGVINIGSNNLISIKYSSFGQKIIKFIIKYHDNTQATTYAYLKLVKQKSVALSASLASACDRDETITATRSFTDYENNTYKGKGNIHYYFSTSTPCNGSVKKPIIILDGFDPGDKRSISQLYDVYLNNPGRYKFGDEMRSKGYDIVVLNFPGYTNEFGKTIDGGANYIERNAFVLISVIHKLNYQLRFNGSSEKLVIIGPSMGGIISRYALAYMEKNNMPHNTRLWISLDAPQNGANIPIGGQKYVEFFANNGNKGAQETLQKQLNSPAAKQQLLHHYLSYSELPVGAPGFRDRFVLALSNNGVAGSKGFPVIPRKVALVDGSLDGTLQPNSAACQKVLNSKSYLVINTFLFKTKLFRIADASIYFTGSYNNACTVLSASQLSKGSVTAKGSAPAASVSYDVAPGGSRASFTTLADQGQGYSEFFQFLFELGSYNEFNVYQGSHSFASTKSALAFKGTNEDLAENVYNRNLVCTGETPFNTYYGGTKNLEHVYIDSAMANFTIDEIAGKQRTPSYVSSLPFAYIAGPDLFCDSVGIYALGDGSVSPGTKLAWSVSPAIASISFDNDSTQVKLSKISSGTATLSLQLTGTCGLNQSLTKTFSIGGYSSSDYPVSGPSSACNNQLVYFNTNQLPGATNYKWIWPVDWTHVYGQGSSSIGLITGKSSGSVSVKVANACDAGGIPATKYVQVNNCSFVMNATPNPTVGDVTITTGQTQSLRSVAIADKIYKLEVMDILGNIKKKFSYSPGETNIKINLGTLINGTYIIRVYNGKVWAYKIIVIAH